MSQGVYGVYNNELDLKDGIISDGVEKNISFAKDKRFQEK